MSHQVHCVCKMFWPTTRGGPVGLRCLACPRIGLPAMMIELQVMFMWELGCYESNSPICRVCNTRVCRWRWWWGWWSSRAWSSHRSQSPPGCPTCRWVEGWLTIILYFAFHMFTMAGTSSLHLCGPWGSPTGRCRELPLRPKILKLRAGESQVFLVLYFWFELNGQCVGWWRWGTERKLRPTWWSGVEAPWRSPRYAIKHGKRDMNPKIRILKCDLSMRGKNLNQFSQSVIQRGGSTMAKRSSRIKDHPKD